MEDLNVSFNRRAFLRISGSCAAMIAAGPAVIKSKVFAEEPLSSNISDVSFVGSSAGGTRKQMIIDVLEPWREKVKEGIEGKTIVIKVNVVSSFNPLVA